MSDLRWIVTEYNLGPYLTKEAARADALHMRKTTALPANSHPHLVEVRKQTLDDLPAGYAARLREAVLDLLEEDPAVEGFTCFDASEVSSTLRGELQAVLAKVYREGVAVLATADWIATGTVESLDGRVATTSYQEY